MDLSKVSSDAMPALTGRRCVGTVTEWPDLPANKVVPQKVYFLSLFPSGNKGFFVERSFQNDQETSGKAMAGLTIPPSSHINISFKRSTLL